MTTGSRAAVRRLALARATSLTGGAAAFAALNFAIYQRTHSPGWVAASLLLTWGTGGIASIFAGSLGDRFDRKAVMVVSDLAGAAVFGVMAFVDDPGWLIAWAFLSALVESPFLAASAAAIPNLVDDEHIGWANGLVTLGTNAGIVLGPLAGGVLVATIGPGPVFALNAVSFVVSAALVWSVTGSFSGRRDDASEHAGVWAGIRFLTRERVLRAVALAWIPLAAGQGMTIVADVPLVGLFGAGGVGYGILISCWGLGSILGTLCGRFLNRRNEPLVFAAGAGVVAVTAVLTGLSPWFWGVLAAILVMGIGEGSQVVAQQVIVQRRTPDAVRSRVAAGFESVAHLSLAFSFAIAGPVVRWLGPRGTYVLGGLVGLLALVAVVPAFETRHAPDEGTPTPSTTGAASMLLGYSSGDTDTTASTR